MFLIIQHNLNTVLCCLPKSLLVYELIQMSVGCGETFKNTEILQLGMDSLSSSRVTKALSSYPLKMNHFMSELYLFKCLS